MAKKIALLLIISMFILTSCFSKRQTLKCDTTSGTSNTIKKIIDYQILRKWIPGISGVGMDILVSECASKEEVLKLARKLRKESKPKGSVFISIFDTKEAWRNRENSDYPDSKYFKHFLVSIIINPHTGHEQLIWMAKGRKN